MTPVDQTVFGDDGNCLSATVASVFGLALSKAPDLRGERWWPTLTMWLRFKGWAPLYSEELPPEFTGYCVGLGDGPPRGDGARGRHHAVVWRGGPEGGIAHDPHPSRAGLVAWPHGYVLFVPLNPSGMIR